MPIKTVPRIFTSVVASSAPGIKPTKALIVLGSKLSEGERWSMEHSLFLWVVDSQFARIRKMNGFARIRPGYPRLLDIV